MSRHGVIYKLFFTNGEAYIGSTVSFKDRMALHRKKYDDIQRYVLLDTIIYDDKKDMTALEQKYMDECEEPLRNIMRARTANFESLRSPNSPDCVEAKLKAKRKSRTAHAENVRNDPERYNAQKEKDREEYESKKGEIPYQESRKRSNIIQMEKRHMDKLFLSVGVVRSPYKSCSSLFSHQTRLRTMLIKKMEAELGVLLSEFNPTVSVETMVQSCEEKKRLWYQKNETCDIR